MLLPLHNAAPAITHVSTEYNWTVSLDKLQSITLKPSTGPEAELLLACARTTIDNRTAERIRILLREDLDWSYLFEKAHQNCIMPLLYWNLNAACAEAVPNDVLNQLRAYFQGHARHNLFRTSELLNLLRLLDEHEIPALPFKGPILAALVYGNISLRQFGDLDILVHK